MYGEQNGEESCFDNIEYDRYVFCIDFVFITGAPEKSLMTLRACSFTYQCTEPGFTERIFPRLWKIAAEAGTTLAFGPFTICSTRTYFHSPQPK